MALLRASRQPLLLERPAPRKLHPAPPRPTADAPAAVHAAAVAALESDILRLGRLAVGARLSDEALAKQAGAARAVADEWRLHAVARRIGGGEPSELAVEGFARAEAYAARAATLGAQRAQLALAMDAVRTHMRAVEQAAEDARAARDIARDVAAGAATEAAAAAAAEVLAGGDPLAQEAALRGLRCAAHDAVAARTALLDRCVLVWGCCGLGVMPLQQYTRAALSGGVSSSLHPIQPLLRQCRHDVTAGKAEHWHQEWRRHMQAMWAQEGDDDTEAAAEHCLQRRAPYAARATTLQLHLDTSAEAASRLMLRLRIAETRLAEALAAAAAAQAQDEGEGGEGDVHA